MTTKVSLTSQIAAVNAAAEGKEFPARSGAERLQREHLQAALETLRWIKIHEADIRGLIERKRSVA